MGDMNAEGEWAGDTVKRPPQEPAQPPVRQRLCPADAETAPQGTRAAAALGTQRPDAARGGEGRVTVQGPVKKQRPDRMSHGGWGVGRVGRP